MSSPAPAQLMLFETVSTPNGDGSFTVKPRRLVDGKEISAAAAARMLGFKDKETVYNLVKTRQIRGWRPDTARGNGKYKIDLGSVLDYKAARLAAR